MSKRYPWLSLGKKTAPEIPYESPIWLGNHSNGEYFHHQTEREARIRQEILRRGDEQARRLGMDRRQFMASSMGMAMALTVLNESACSKSNGEAAAPGCVTDAGFAVPQSGTPYVVPPQAACEAGAMLTVDQFIFDVQTHCFDDGAWRTQNIVYPTFLSLTKPMGCTEANALDCFDPDNYAELMFVDSQTTMSVITSWPAAQCFPGRSILGNAPVACGLPLSNEGMRNLRDWINTRAMSQRCINQVQVMPNDFLEYQIEGMYAAMQDPTWKCGSWKAYPAWVSDTYPNDAGFAQGYFLTDPIGIAFIEAGLKLGVPNFAIHKGLPIPGFDVLHNEPTDIGPIAKMYPEANFVIYHSAICAGTGGGTLGALNPPNTEMVPYSATGAVTGVNMLIRSLLESGIIQDPDVTGQPVKPCNVYAEMGSAWSKVMSDPNLSAQHYIGKLLKYLGPNNMCWGTDCVLYGSPQAQITAFQSFQILPQFQAPPYNYPALTDAMKAQIFGLNAARLYHVDPTAARCQATSNTFTMMQRELNEEIGPNRWAIKPPLGPRNTTEFFEHAKRARAKGVPG